MGMDGHGRAWTGREGYGRVWTGMERFGRIWIGVDVCVWMGMKGYGYGRL